MNAHTVSLADLAAAAGTSTADLAAGLQQSDDAVAEVSGCVARASSPVAFDFSQATPAITVAAVKLLGPCTAILEGLAIGVEEPPGAYTMGGGTLILVGSCLFVFSARSEQAVVRIGE